jgi:hypothetical protein
LKKHSFFKGIDFEEVSSESFNGCLPYVEEIKERVEAQ